MNTMASVCYCIPPPDEHNKILRKATEAMRKSSIARHIAHLLQEAFGVKDLGIMYSIT